MIVITGNVRTNAGNRAEIERLCIEHSQRSRREAGCYSHNVHVDCEQPDLLVFLEHWHDAEAVKAHFAVPESRAFVGRVSALATEAPIIRIYEAREIPIGELAS